MVTTGGVASARRLHQRVAADGANRRRSVRVGAVDRGKASKTGSISPESQ